MKGERHDPTVVAPELLDQIRALSLAGKSAEFIRKKFGLAYRTVEKVGALHGLVFRKNVRTDEVTDEVIAEFGGLSSLLAILNSMREERIGWQRISERVGLNRYACRVMVETGRVPSFRNIGRKLESKGNSVSPSDR